jgi:hypothetical protein
MEFSNPVNLDTVNCAPAVGGYYEPTRCRDDDHQRALDSETDYERESGHGLGDGLFAAAELIVEWFLAE